MKTLYAKGFIIISAFALLLISSCNKEDVYINPLPTKGNAARSYSGETVRNYFTLLCRVSKTTSGFFPPQVARSYSYVGLAAYESVVNGIPHAQSLAGQLNGLSNMPKPSSDLEYNWGICSSTAIAEMIRKMYEKTITPQNLESIDSLENAALSNFSIGVSEDVVNRSIQFGKDVTNALYQYSVTDGGHESYLDPFQLPYTLPVGPYCWIPTGGVKTPISPYWSKNRPFITDDIEHTQPLDHVPFSTDPSSEFYNQAMAVYNQMKNNTSEQIEIAKYWADDPFNTCTPAGHTFNVLIQLLEENNATLEKTSVGFAKLGIAENDVFIACWKGKYQYTLIRPVSYINEYIDPTFTTVIGTPPFPAYTSGHSCEIGAGAAIFTNMFTDGSGKYNFTDFSQLQYGYEPRSFTSFDEMAQECADSRFYGGIHYPMDNESGLVCGKAVGSNINNLLHWPQNIK